MSRVGEFAFNAVEAAAQATTVVGVIGALGASEAVQRETALLDIATNSPDAPITIREGLVTSGDTAVTLLEPSLTYHKEFLTGAEVALGMGVGAMAVISLYTNIRHFRRLGAKRYLQRSLGR